MSYVSSWQKKAMVKTTGRKNAFWSGHSREAGHGWNRVNEEHDGWCEDREKNADQMMKISGFQRGGTI